jgi:hypothetical protein
MNDRAEVCPLSRRAMSQPVSRPLQTGIRFLRIPLPAPPLALLTVGLPIGQRYGLTLFRMILRMVQTRPMRRRRTVHDGSLIRSHSLPHTVLVQACQHVWLVRRNGAFRTFTCIGRTHPSLAPLRPVLADSALPRGSAYRVSGGYFVPGLHAELLPVLHARVGNS